MSWVRPKYFKIDEEHGLLETELLKTQEPWAEAPTRSSLNFWEEKVKANGHDYLVARYAALSPAQKIPMRVFGIFIRRALTEDRKDLRPLTEK